MKRTDYLKAKYLIFNGRKYQFQMAFAKKSDAKGYADGFRRDGYHARTIKVKRHYEVWVSLSKRKIGGDRR